MILDGFLVGLGLVLAYTSWLVAKKAFFLLLLAHVRRYGSPVDRVKLRLKGYDV